MTVTSPDQLVDSATELAGCQAPISEASERLMTEAGGNRRLIVATRDQLAGRVRAKVDDYQATATLQLLNRVLSHVPVEDPLDWKPRWAQRFRRP